MGAGGNDDCAYDAGYVPAGRKLAIVAATSILVVAAFYVGGPGLGMAMAALAAALLVVMAVRLAPESPIVPPTARDGRSHLLLIAGAPLENGAAIERVAAAAGSGEAAPGEILVLAPHRPRFGERWTSDVDRGRERAEDRLVLTLASLAKAGVAADARVGDENVVQAVDDQLRSYPATQVVLIDDGDCEPQGSAAARQLESRLRVPFLRLTGTTTAPPRGSSRARHPGRDDQFARRPPFRVSQRGGALPSMAAVKGPR